MFDCVYSTRNSLPCIKKHNGDDAHQNYGSDIAAVTAAVDDDSMMRTSMMTVEDDNFHSASLYVCIPS